MSSKRTDTNSNDESMPLDHSIVETHYGKVPAQGRFVEKVRLKPNEQQRLWLGTFTEDVTPRGFSVAVSPDPNPAGSIVTQVAPVGTTKQYKLIMHIANYGTKAVTAEVWQL